MLDPIMAPPLLAFAALALGMWQLRRWLEEANPITFAPIAPVTPAVQPPGGRHRPGGDRTPYQPTPAERPAPTPAQEPLPQRTPGDALAAERKLVALPFGELPDWDQHIYVKPAALARFEEVSWARPDTHPVPCGYPDVTPCICSVQQADAPFGVSDGETRELERVR